jgi:hypothetical protein
MLQSVYTETKQVHPIKFSRFVKNRHFRSSQQAAEGNLIFYKIFEAKQLLSESPGCFHRLENRVVLELPSSNSQSFRSLKEKGD